ncbi:sensor histidine kinase [Clostridium estertheticum]|uniref:sensor histidine kinase n=1 Tax=Clostridium estertheticum TaxID=238834 RepID=UPI001C7CD3B9|nr:HAMP domain-containing sensor histidine kinase [Clostridium estertheticum]MBX4265552.1 HAMP domain-containing histidine kinase [Clostridium estertheticum]MBX4271931.1 HAMP domain-containing histidine kinase [Clostridium estertheticum]WLC82104.1 HAMP domain-containing histidine kinase [Clostridium estertheticum]WLC91102.1 HAMP domain-containing histidine kinase [Clostridium estertheticum]
MLRNREFRQFVILFSLMAAVVVILGFEISRLAGILATSSVVAFGTAFFAFTKARYKGIARISDQIDLVLHNADHLYIGESDEGELSILHSEITKMTLRIREQNDVLKKEKEHLAGSLADIAHQLRTPLTSVNLILSLLANNTDENQRKAFVRETEELLVRMDWLITSLLRLSRLDAGIVVFQSEKIDINNLICAALRPFLIPMELHDIDFQIDAPKGMIIQGDSGWLSEAIQNILKNCMESAGENGKIEIVCTDNPLFTEIAIHDSGAGFEKEDLPCLFDRFYRGKNPNATGYGIGLSLCKMIITRQGGTISAKNHLQGGAIFAIRFPK